MPVGHAVTATSECAAPAVGVDVPEAGAVARCAPAAASPDGSVDWPVLPVLAVVPAAAGGAAGLVEVAAGPRTPATRSTISWGVSASRSEVGEGRLDQRAGQLGEQLEVRAVAAGRRGDQEGDVRGAVLGPEVHRRAQPGEGERRLVHPGGAAVGDRDATGQAGGRGALAGEGVLDELVDVGGSTGSVDDLGQGPDGVVLVGAEADVEAHQIGRDQV